MSEKQYKFTKQDCIGCREYCELQQQNEELKKRLNWIAFGDDSELALRYLRKIGYVDFDDERKCYINKHNNEPFFLDDEEEKNYYLKDEELDEYTKQLEQENKELKKQYSKLEDKYIKNISCCNEKDCDLYKEYLESKNILTEFEKWLEEEIKLTKLSLIEIITFKRCLEELQELKKEGKK